MKKIAAITMARNDEFFLNRWISYYGRELGEENLYILLDGEDQKIPALAGRANIQKLPHKSLPREKGDQYRIGLLSDLARDLFQNGYELVIGCDSDEFLAADPLIGKSLRTYLSDIDIKTSVSGLGLDVGQDLNGEDPIDSRPFMQQRKYAVIYPRYTKPVVMVAPGRRWGAGFHRIKGCNFHIDPNLYLFHTGSCDYEMLRSKFESRGASWGRHLRKASRTIFKVTRQSDHARGEWAIAAARIIQTFFRPIYAINKPTMFGWRPVVHIPERFKKCKL